jgi:aminoglycoside phosphotransferase (APT) family kinase protein
VTARTRDTSPAATRRARTMVAAIIEHHLDTPPRRVVAAGGGLTNHVYSVEHPEGALIVRVNESAEKLNDFIKEQWAIARAHAAGVPVPEVLEVGMQAVPHPYMISRRMRGENAKVHRHRRKVLQQMGHLGALINSIPTDGYGQTFDWSRNRLSHNESWGEFLDRELEVEARLRLLERSGMMTAARSRQVRGALHDVPKASLPSRLNHGDMRPKNVLADERGNVTAIIDWEDCCANPPLWDLSVALHDLSIDEKRAYLEAYGIEERELLSIASAVKALNLVNYAATIRTALEAGDQGELAHLRLRLAGVFDLYSLPEHRPSATGARAGGTAKRGKRAALRATRAPHQAEAADAARPRSVNAATAGSAASAGSPPDASSAPARGSAPYRSGSPRSRRSSAA